MKPYNLLTLGASATGVRAANDTDSFVSTCTDFVNHINLENITVGFSEYIPAGGNTSLSDIPSVCSTSPQQVGVELCRVNLNVLTTARSGIRLETFFSRDYNGRFLSTGNKGLGGCKWKYNHSSYSQWADNNPGVKFGDMAFTFMITSYIFGVPQMLYARSMLQLTWSVARDTLPFVDLAFASRTPIAGTHPGISTPRNIALSFSDELQRLGGRFSNLERALARELCRFKARNPLPVTCFPT
jgi:hypothetical protein